MSNTLSSQNTSLPNPTSFNSYNANDEIDLRELFFTLWQSKVLIVCVTLLFGVCAGLFAYIQPNVYRATATLQVDADPYNFVQSRGYNPGGQIVQEANIAFPYLSSNSTKQDIISGSDLEPGSLNGLSVSKDREGNITVAKQANSPDGAYQSVALFANHINDAYKHNELKKVQATLKATEQLVSSHQGKVQEVLAEKYAQLLFKQAILISPDSVLVKVISQPVKPTSHIKPKRALIVVLGTMLGGMLGVAIVLIRFAFRREEETEK
ncbi:Wzz/FepE/Etk N-terminal domain-containing protein [Vibrio taketomensis]|uniref:Wzz/FepE/Etk N-terminal domain-containing protein n=1 Tax=Vibrio taketomensis TaxID=2572923 RepID=UPI001E34AC53|nr:Wzz/FepE/Etk N-terminal domain-containing protein [Vibrio taketomensis]